MAIIDESKKKKTEDVKFITSLVLAAPDKDDVPRHFQIVIVQNVEDGQFRLFFDVLDPSKLPKFADDEDVKSE